MFNQPITSALLALYVDALAARFPHMLVDIYGTSRLGRPLYALTIGAGPCAVMINASHHANEWITTLIALRFLENYAAAPLENVSVCVIPMVNPDGVDLVTGGIAPNRPAYQAAQQLSHNFPNDWKANIIGVDLNSNYPAHWEKAQQHKFERGYIQPGPRDFVGPHPLSEPESTAMVAYTHLRDFDATISLHTQGEEIYWRYQDFNPPRADALAHIMSDISGYIREDVPSESSHAGYRDWFIQTFNRPGFTIECGYGENPLPITDFAMIYEKVSPMLMAVVAYYSHLR